MMSTRKFIEPVAPGMHRFNLQLEPLREKTILNSLIISKPYATI